MTPSASRGRCASNERGQPDGRLVVMGPAERLGLQS